MIITEKKNVLRQLLHHACWLFLVHLSLAEKHPHRGVVKPFSSGDPGVKLSSTALAILRKGKPFTTQIQDGSAGRGLVVQDVQAPVEVVWEKILAFDKYPQMVPKTVDCKVYKAESLRGGKRRIYVRMKVGFPFLKLQFFINHLHDPHLNSLTWTLDYDRKSDLDDSAGYWYCIPHPDRPEVATRVFYSVEVSMFAWVPQFVVDFMSKQALTDATGWVKKFSEKEVAVKSDRQQIGEVNPEGSKRESKKRFNVFSRFFRRRRRREESNSDMDAIERGLPNTSSTLATAHDEEKRILRNTVLVGAMLLFVAYNIYAAN